MKQHYMTEKERYILEGFLRAKKPVSWIAREMGFCRKTIYNEMKRGAYTRINRPSGIYVEEICYSAEKAQQVHDYNQTAKGRPLKIGSDRSYADFLENKIIRDRYSPAAALAVARSAGYQTQVSVNTLYSYIEKGIFLQLSNKHLWVKGKRKKPGKKKERRVVHSKLPSIEIRPAYINDRMEPGHWEMDLVIGKKSKGDVLLTLIERSKRQGMIFKLPDRKAETVRRVFDDLERQMPDFKSQFKTITTDNGTEFLEYDLLTRSIHGGKRFDMYYCHSYSAWEKGSNENFNRMIRRFYPKKTDFSKVTKKQIAELQNWMNSYPRKILGWKAPNDLIS